MDLVDDGTLRNLADLPSKKNKWSADSKGYLAADSQQISFDKKKKEAERRRRAIIDTSTEAMLDELGLSTGRSVASAKKAT
jgi:hypothetical protein